MSLQDTLKKNLTPEQFAAVQEALGDDFDYDMVPRSRLNKVINQRNQARKELSELLDGGESGDGGEGSGAGNPSGKPIGLTQVDLDAVNAQHATEMKNLRMQFAATGMLRDFDFIDPQMVLDAKLLDFSKVTTDESGKITGGLEDQIKALAESKTYLVKPKDPKRGTGKSGGSDGFGAVTTKEEFMKLSTDKQIEFKNTNPEVFKTFMNS